jgi:Raf kinase inhibitor-like YbhB/YbcL family protein
MHLRSDSFQPYDFIDLKYAFGKAHATRHVELSSNLNPHLAWSDVPEGTRSFALLAWDPEVPTVGTDVNQEGRSVPLDLPRADFFHWVLYDLPADLREIAAGAHASGVTARGKAPGAAPQGLQGLNDYTGWFAGDPDMAGNYGGYDGPCPPWNDTRVHAYIFEIYALDVPKLEVEGRVDGAAVRRALPGHVLGSARITALYTLNPVVAARAAQKLGALGG